MNILIACEESQAITIEMRKRGHNCFSCDIQECSGGHPEWHIKSDCLPLLDGNCTFTTEGGQMHTISGKWDMIIAHPPCTYLSNAGARSLYPQGVLNRERYQKGLEAKSFFLKILNADCDRIAVENPVSSRIFQMPKHTQQIQPYQFGHPYKKLTRLWLKNLPCLVPTKIVDVAESTKIAGNWFNKGGKERQKNRAKTFPGIAKAIAEQWG